MDLTSVPLMMLLDSSVCGLSAVYLIAAMRFIKVARKNINKRQCDMITSQHFSDHLTASFIGLVGGTIGFGFAVLHFFSQNIFNTPMAITDLIEIGESVGVMMILISGILFMLHMTSEETPGNPYYIQDYKTVIENIEKSDIINFDDHKRRKKAKA